ncbi:50S ribosomal protein L23 [Candidatus Giovannonibacteria bacterium RIFCSPHIGHO2_01_FULL_48_47]|nr:MAG: 50S ribosomal protein L23 [Candidatus Giovannonibacteria bacterium RIFCSPHIGHO2_01_FULL_48_47]OGF68681.1 MAG: 50S ribosomal protein L23 [Candidatus Giovannonibacteria bacterium RIFCSPHIGHO2_02_FULL_48_15]OGF89597.1 MAG: 50S ribosomal protein L23 [Candidatus Giovannonibacteria bacterium RIFCSPLOWO2_01_FULL_48_47]OGF94492.1 MAG: 50S ribosomal protein L23 [Candidatus Giovannonibacteria bacterium RIFOXYC1_FULL_48_8]OGF96386.1 MAG: 50S ribosomal protein L23 [Candidatus Giovannonibacteria bac
MDQILVKPMVSEKNTLLSSRGVYVFQVENEANKITIKKAVERLYKVRVERVNLVKVLPKKRILRGRVGFRPGYKKALVFLAAGQKIDLT